MDFRYTGVIQLTPDVEKIFNMHSDRKTVPFGFSSECCLDQVYVRFIGG